MSPKIAKRWKWLVLAAIPVLILTAMLPYVQARRRYAITQKLLTECVNQRRPREIKKWLAQGADPNGRCLAHCSIYTRDGTPPLQLSILGVALNSVAPLQLLLDAGADINGKADNGLTALMQAANRPSPEIVKFLIDNGADVNLRTEPMSLLDISTTKKVTMSALDFVNLNSIAKTQRRNSNLLPITKLNRIKKMLVEAGAK